jgi:predicted regulator of Ras-like GTPase activity (Roadblock/LC7/MglB family)
MVGMGEQVDPDDPADAEPGARMFGWLSRWRREADAAEPSELPAEEASSGLPAAGAVLGGRYALDALIGRGATGLVYRGRDLRLEVPVAIKVAPHDPESGVLGDLRGEMKAQLTLAHPGVVRVLHWEVYGGCEALVMELVDGPSVNQLLRATPDRRMPPADALRIVLDLLDVLGHAHAGGVVHNDVKPANLLLGPDGRLKVCDFGIADRVTRSPARAGPVTGTIAFLAPERLRREAASPASDLYAAAATLYLLLTGHAPFGTGGAATQSAHLVEPLPPSEFIPEALFSVIAKAMEKVADARYRSAAEFAEALRAAAGASDVTVPLRASTPVAEPRASTLDDAESGLASGVHRVARSARAGDHWLGERLRALRDALASTGDGSAHRASLGALVGELGARQGVRAAFAEHEGVIVRTVGEHAELDAAGDAVGRLVGAGRAAASDLELGEVEQVLVIGTHRKVALFALGGSAIGLVADANVRLGKLLSR